MRKNRLQAFRSLGTAGILMLTMWLVIFTGQTVHAAAKPVKKVTVKAGETYNIVVTGKCSAYQNTRRAVL